MPTFKIFKSAFAVLSLAAATSAQTVCNPLTATCPAAPGLPASTYSVDFTQLTTLPANWTLATAETVTYGSMGADFTFAKRYDAPYIWTDFYFLFGSVEIIAQAAPGRGIISSLVLISEDLDEIDWEFSGTNFNATSSGIVQTNYFGKGITGNYDRGIQVPTSFTPQSGFHTYTLDWTSTQLTWSIDGSVVRVLANNGDTSGDYQYPQTPMQVHLGLWDAGDADTSIGTVDWAGGYTDLADAPFSAYVKSVSISTTPCASYSYSGTSGSYSSIMCGNTTAAADGANSPQQVNGNQAPGSAATTAAPAQGTTAVNGTVVMTVWNTECSCMMTKMTSGSLPDATGAPGAPASNASMPYSAPTNSTMTVMSPSPSTYTKNAGGRLTVAPFGGVIGLLGFFLL